MAERGNDLGAEPHKPYPRIDLASASTATASRPHRRAYTDGLQLKGLSFMPGPPLRSGRISRIGTPNGTVPPARILRRRRGASRARRSRPSNVWLAGARCSRPRARARRFPGLERARGRIAAGVVDPDQRPAAEVRDEEGDIRRAERAGSRSPTTSAAATGGASSTAASSSLWQIAKLARADAIESKVEFEAGPAANNPGLRAVLRRYAQARRGNAPLRQTGSTAGPVRHLASTCVAFRRIDSARRGPRLGYVGQHGAPFEAARARTDFKRCRRPRPVSSGLDPQTPRCACAFVPLSGPGNHRCAWPSRVRAVRDCRGGGALLLACRPRRPPFLSEP